MRVLTALIIAGAVTASGIMMVHGVIESNDTLAMIALVGFALSHVALFVIIGLEKIIGIKAP